MRKFLTAVSVTVLMLILFWSGTAAAGICYVPDDFATIQSALDGAVSGDTVIVRDGVWKGAGNKDLDFKGKSIRLLSENGPKNCIIDCELAGRGFYFHNGETATSVVDGFTITNGVTTYLGDFPDGWGGGISCVGSSPTIMNCIIDGNEASGAATGSGGAISCYSFASPTITNCIMSNNSADWGGAIYCNFYSSPLISNCTLIDNLAQGGGGIYTANYSSPDILNCIMWNDSASDGPEIEVVQDSSLSVLYSNVSGGQVAAYVCAGCYLGWGAGNINSDPYFAAGPLGDYYLSQTAAGQLYQSPCVDAGNDTAANLDLDAYTTRTDHVGDAGIVDMGYHYWEVREWELTQISLLYPEKQALLSAPPEFAWMVDGGSNNGYSVDFALTPFGPFKWSTYGNLHETIYDTVWTMPESVWNRIPSGRRIYWRVRGADFDQTPLTIIYSDEVWSFIKQ